MSKTNTLKTRSKDKSQGATSRPTDDVSRISESGTDWAALEAMTEEEVMAAALSDPDAQPWTKEQLANAKRKPRCYSIRIALRMTQEQFADAFRIPVGTIRDWEQWRTEPDQAAKAYLKVIAVNPQYVLGALAHVPGQPKPRAD